MEHIPRPSKEIKTKTCSHLVFIEPLKREEAEQNYAMQLGVEFLVDRKLI